MFLNVCKQILHISHVRISQKVKGVLMWNLQHIFLHMKTKILADFQICISAPLIIKANWCQLSDNKFWNERQLVSPIYNQFDLYNFCKACIGRFLDTKTYFFALNFLQNCILFTLWEDGSKAAKEEVSLSYLTLWRFLDLNLVSFIDSYGFLIIWETFFLYIFHALKAT